MLYEWYSAFGQIVPLVCPSVYQLAILFHVRCLRCLHLAVFYVCAMIRAGACVTVRTSILRVSTNDV